MSTVTAQADALRERIRAILHDEDATPVALTRAGELLGDLEAWERDGERLEARLEKFLRRANGEEPRELRSTLELIQLVMQEAEGPMHYRDVAAAILAAGYEYTPRQMEAKKGPERQLTEAVYQSLGGHPDLFRKVGRGIWEAI